MKTIRNTTFLALILVIMHVTSMAYAEPKPWVWSWWEEHWAGLDFEPYLENGKHPHNSQWNESNWQPAHWTAQRDSEMQVIRGLYRADVLRDQYVDDGVPVLEIGPGFYLLGGEEKRRAVEMVDYVYGITSNKLFGMFMLYDWRDGKPIGAYTQYGLQLQ